MKINENVGLYHMVQDISPEAYKAQRLAELADVAEYRARKIAAYKAWSDPEQRAKMRAEAIAEEQRAKEIMAGKTVYLPAWRKIDDMVKMTAIVKPSPKNIWQRLKAKLGFG